MRFLAEELLHHFADARHSGHSPDQHHFGDVLGFEPGILKRFLARIECALDQIVDQFLEVGAGDGFDQMERSGRPAFHPSGDERLVDFSRLSARQLDLGFFGGFLEPLKREPVGAQVDAFLGLELVGQELDDLGVEILAAEEGVAVGRLHFEHTVADFQHRDVERAAAKIINRDRLAVVLVEAISERSGGRLVDDAQNFKSSDLAGVLGRLTLGIVEIGGDGDHRLGDGLTQERLGGFLHLLKDEGRDLRRRIILAAGLDPGVAIGALDDLVGHQFGVLLGNRIVEAAADQALDRENRVVGIGHRLALGRLTDQAFAFLGESDSRRSRARAFRILDNLGFSAFHDGDTAIGRAQVDPNDLGHKFVLSNAPFQLLAKPSECVDFGGDIGGVGATTRT